MIKNKRGEHFKFALIAIFLSIFISLIAFNSEGNKITGYVTSTADEVVVQQSLLEFEDVSSLNSLASGNYYLDDYGVVYWLDDTSRPAIARLNFVSDSQKNRAIYIDNNGNIGYLI